MTLLVALVQLAAVFGEIGLELIKAASPEDKAALVRRHNERMEFFLGWIESLKDKA